MTTFIGLLRGVNVGGNSMLAMPKLAALCHELGFQTVRTYIQSGNVIFESRASEKTVQTRLERALEKHMGKSIDVMVRTAAELRAILDANPFEDAEPAKVMVVFLREAVPKELLKGLAAPAGEEVRLGKRELYVYYPEGMGRSKLKLPVPAGGKAGTARNMNTVAKLVAMTNG